MGDMASEATGALGSIGQLVTGIIGGQKTNSALQTGINNASGALNSAYGTAATYQQPYDSAGATGLSGQQNIANMAPAQSNFQYNYQQDPAYQNQLASGNNNLQSQAGSLGSLFSGATMKAINQYGSNLANQSYNQNYNRAFNTYTNQRDFNQNALSNKYNQYAELTGIGQNAANQLTGLQTQLGQGQANLDIQSGNANAGQQAALWNNLGNFATNLTGVSQGGGPSTSGGNGTQPSGGSMGGMSSLFSSLMSKGGGSGSDNGGTGVTMGDTGGGLTGGDMGGDMGGGGGGD